MILLASWGLVNSMMAEEERFVANVLVSHPIYFSGLKEMRLLTNFLYLACTSVATGGMSDKV
jgi:hypothetical protein